MIPAIAASSANCDRPIARVAHAPSAAGARPRCAALGCQGHILALALRTCESEVSGPSLRRKHRPTAIEALPYGDLRFSRSGTLRAYGSRHARSLPAPERKRKTVRFCWFKDAPIAEHERMRRVGIRIVAEQAIARWERRGVQEAERLVQAGDRRVEKSRIAQGGQGHEIGSRHDLYAIA